MSEWQHPSTAPVGVPVLVYATKDGPNSCAVKVMGKILYGTRMSGSEVFQVVLMEGFNVDLNVIDVCGWMPLPDAPDELPAAPEALADPSAFREPPKQWFPAGV